jgi:hypothetical protein
MQRLAKIKPKNHKTKNKEAAKQVAPVKRVPSTLSSARRPTPRESNPATGKERTESVARVVAISR